MSVEENKALARQFVKGWNQGALEAFDEICATDFVYHDSGNPDVYNLTDYKQFVVDFRTFLPDYHFTIEDMIAEGDKVVVRGTGRGTNQQTGAQDTLICMNIVRFAEGKVREYWCTWIWENQG